MMARLPDWRGRLSACIDASLQRPFEWGVHDCALFAADAVLAMTGTDVAVGWRGRYRSAAGAKRILRKTGYLDHGSMAGTLLGEIPPALAVVGGVAVVEGPDGPALGVVLGATIAVPGTDGLGFLPRSEALRTFHVPFDGEAA